MKIYRLMFLLALGIAIAARGADENIRSSVPTAKTTVILLKERNWTVDELNQKALEYLRNTGEIPSGLDLQARVSILLDDKKLICKITYSQGFERPFWIVKIGRSGDVVSVEKSRLREKN